MELQRHFGDGVDLYIFGQTPVQGFEEPFFRDRRLLRSEKTGGKILGMHPGIGAAAADKVYRLFIIHFGQVFLDDLLYGEAVWLDLPAAVIAAVVSDLQQITFDRDIRCWFNAHILL